MPTRSSGWFSSTRVSRTTSRRSTRSSFPRKRIQPDDWIGTTEQIDELAPYTQARALQGHEPDITLMYIATYDLPPDPKMAAAVLQGQQTFVERFSPGRLIRLDVPNYMEPVIPERIAREVERVIEAAVGS